MKVFKRVFLHNGLMSWSTIVFAFLMPLAASAQDAENKRTPATPPAQQMERESPNNLATEIAESLDSVEMEDTVDGMMENFSEEERRGICQYWQLAAQAPAAVHAAQIESNTPLDKTKSAEWAQAAKSMHEIVMQQARCDELLVD